jgi:hypothetical protein
MRVNSLMVPPGIPDFYSRRRVLDAGVVEIVGRAWSGAAPVTEVALGVDGEWTRATLETAASPYAWVGWRATWRATEGAHELACRATDATGTTQPLEPPWDLSGFGNNAVQRVQVNVRPAGALIGQIRHGSIPSQERTR